MVIHKRSNTTASAIVNTKCNRVIWIDETHYWWKQVTCKKCLKTHNLNKTPKGFKEGICKCGNHYYYCGMDIGLCVKCIDKLEDRLDAVNHGITQSKDKEVKK